MDENTNEQSLESNSFGELTERTDEGSEKPVLIKDKVSETEVESKDETTEETKTGAEAEVKTEAKAETEPALTEKGTKLDPNPESAIHQQLANERARARQYEAVLSNPELLKKYMETQFGASTKVEEPKETVKEYTAEDFENLDDVAKTINGLQQGFSEKVKTYEQKIKELEGMVGGLVNNTHAQHVATTVGQDVSVLRDEPELNSKSPEYIEGLEEDIVAEYNRLDYDARTDSYRGNHSIAEIGKRLIGISRKARKAGSLEAQTVVKDKSQGKVTTSSKVSDEPNTDDLSPGDSIALGISKTWGK